MAGNKKCRRKGKKKNARASTDHLPGNNLLGAGREYIIQREIIPQQCRRRDHDVFPDTRKQKIYIYILFTAALSAQFGVQRGKKQSVTERNNVSCHVTDKVPSQFNTPLDGQSSEERQRETTLRHCAAYAILQLLQEIRRGGAGKGGREHTAGFA